jgi:hypothetical protein
MFRGTEKLLGGVSVVQLVVNVWEWLPLLHYFLDITSARGDQNISSNSVCLESEVSLHEWSHSLSSFLVLGALDPILPCLSPSYSRYGGSSILFLQEGTACSGWSEWVGGDHKLVRSVCLQDKKDVPDVFGL